MSVIITIPRQIKGTDAARFLRDIARVMVDADRAGAAVFGDAAGNDGDQGRPAADKRDTFNTTQGIA
jgi:hypothetical protein